MANYEHELGTLKGINMSEMMATLIKQQPTLFQRIGKGEKINTNKFSWLEKQLTPKQWAITAFATDGDGTGLTFASTTGMIAGMVLFFSKATGAYVTEMVKIVSVNANGTDIVVSRDYDGTAGVTLVVGDIAQGIDAKLEGFTAGSGGVTLPTENYNYTMIGEVPFFLSRNMLTSDKQANYDVLIDSSKDAMIETIWAQSRALIRGRRIARTGSVGGQTGGLIQMMTGGNVNTSGGAITAAHYNATMASIVDDGAVTGNYLAVMNVNQAQKTTALNSVTYGTSNGVVNSQIGGAVKQFIPDFQLPGMNAGLDIFVEPNMPKDMILIVNPDLVKVRYWEEPVIKKLPAGREDGSWFQILTEYGFEIKNGTTAHGMITGLNV